MNKTLLKLAFGLGLSILIISCDFTPGGVSPPSWDLDIIGPIGNAKVTLEDLADFDSLAFDYEVTATQLDPNIQEGTVPFFPAIPAQDIPPDTIPISENFRYAIFDSGFIDFTFSNNLPLTLNSGQIVNIYSIPGPNQTLEDTKIFDFTIDNDLGPGETQSATISDFTGLVVTSELIIEVGDVSTKESTDPVTFTAESGISMTFKFTDLKVREIGISADNSFELSDTAAINFTFDGGATDTELEQGMLRLKFSNGIPLNIDLSLNLLDADKNLINVFLEQGSNVVKASDTSSIFIPLTDENIQLFESTSFIGSKVVLSDQASIGDTVIINTDSLVSLKVIAELDLKVKP